MPSVKSAEGKARQRARNQTMGADQPGSSGIIKQFMKHARYMEWDEVEDEVEHVADIMGIITQGNLGHNTMGVTMTAPLEYAQELTEVYLASRGQLAFIRIYVAPMGILEGEDE